jgi:riboflavin synthase alpha subunit
MEALEFPSADHPPTFEVTALRERKVGDAVNLEADMLGKYPEKFVNKTGS